MGAKTVIITGASRGKGTTFEIYIFLMEMQVLAWQLRNIY